MLSFSGVDSDANWVATARDNSKASHFRFLFADIGKTGAWGTPEDFSLAKIPYNYCGKKASQVDFPSAQFKTKL